jgi:hypothetical protein
VRADAAGAREAAIRLERWGSARDWRGPDPYDGLNAATLTATLRGRSPLALRVLTQAVKRSPVNLRPLLGIPAGLSAATLAHALSAYARNGFLPAPEARAKLTRCVRELSELRLAGFAQPCWGYHFDVQTRVFFYPRSDPNTIATAFAGLGLLDASDYAEYEQAAEMALGAGEFLVRQVPQTRDPSGGPGAFFGYLVGDRTPIHNASLLICALLARLGRCFERQDLLDAAERGVQYAVARQRPDGSWPYGEKPGLEWVDGFHTGYVLDSLLTCIEAGVGAGEAEQAWRRGLRFYAERLLDPDGAPRYKPGARYPVDGQCAAQAIQTLSRAATLEPAAAARRWDVWAYTQAALSRRDGAFVFQRERFWVNRTPHPRWVQAPMLEALTHLLASAAVPP